MSNLSILQSLMKQREQAIRNEMAALNAPDDGSYDRALDAVMIEAARRVEQKLAAEDERRVENARIDASPLVKMANKPAERCGPYRI